MGIGGGKSSGTQTAQVTPEQSRLLGVQTNALENTFIPAYQKTVGMAGDVYGQVNPVATTAANTAMDVASRTGALQEVAGTGALATGLTGLASLFNPQYEEEQVQAALQAGKEATREQVGEQNAMFGGAGAAGSSRAALARENLKSLSDQRLATAAAAARAGVQANKAAAAQALTGAGQAGLTSAQQAAAGRVALAQTPQDVLAKYASVIYGTPQQSTTPNFAGTQGQTTSGKGAGFKFGSA